MKVIIDFIVLPSLGEVPLLDQQDRCAEIDLLGHGLSDQWKSERHALQLALFGAHEQAEQRPAQGRVAGEVVLHAGEVRCNIHRLHTLAQLASQPLREIAAAAVGMDL